MAISYRVSGAGANGGRSNSMIMFTVEIKIDDQIPRSKKTDLQVFVESPTPVTNVKIMGGDRGKFQVGFSSGAAGTYWVDFVYQGTFAQDPYKLPISEGSNCPEIPYEGRQRAAGAPAQTPGSPASPLGVSRGSAVKDADSERLRKEEEEKQKFEEDERIRKETEETQKRQQQREEEERKEEERRRHEEEQQNQQREAKQRERLLKEEEEKRIREEEEKHRKEQEEIRRQARVDAIQKEIMVLTNEELTRDINETLDRLRLLIEEQQKRYT